MSTLPLFLAPYPARQAARAQLGLTLTCVTNAIRLVAWRERLVLEAVDSQAPSWVVQRCAGAWELACADAEEAEHLYERAAVEYEATHLRAGSFPGVSSPFEDGER